VSNLFARDEIDEILQELVPVMKRDFPRRPPTNENLYDFYLSRVKWNLHVALCFSPVYNLQQFRNQQFHLDNTNYVSLSDELNELYKKTVVYIN